MALLGGSQAGAEGVGLPEQQRLFSKQLLPLRNGGIQGKVDAARDYLSHLQRASASKLAVVKPVHKILADLEFFPKLGVGGLGDVHIAIVVLVPLGVLVHGGLQGRSDAHIGYNQAALLILKHPVDPGDGLHQVVAVHGLVDVHGGQGGHVEPGQPHIHHNSNFHGIAIVLEPPGQLLLVALGADDGFPVLRIAVAAGHDNPDLLRPAGPQFQQLPVDFHGDGPGVGHDHGLSCEQVGPVVLIVADNILTQGLNGGVRPQDALHLTQHFFALFDCFGVGLLLQNIVGGVNETQGVLVQLQVDDPALVVHWTGGPVLHRLGHVMDVDIVPEHLPGIPVLDGHRRAGETDKGSIGQSLPDNEGAAYHHPGLPLSACTGVWRRNSAHPAKYW